MIRHVPNAITVSRGLCGPVVMGLVVGFEANWLAFWVFLFAIVTDLVDGFVARRLGAVSEAALVLDPLADKVLTDFTWAGLAIVGFAPPWLAATIVVRDVLVAAIWAWGMPRGRQWPPRPSGQIGVAFEGVALCVLLFHGPWLDVHWPSVGAVLGTVALALSVVQLLEYSVVTRPGGPGRAAGPDS
ncbi:MAG: CDP-alcohol phosphatidyltransferase family protein [Myxococcota bacterium]